MELKDHIRAAKNGDQQAFTFLLETYWNDIYRFLSTKTNRTNEAEDLTIETFAKAFEKIHTFDETKSFKNWLIAIARNNYIDWKRTEQQPPYSIDEITDKRPNILSIPDSNPEEDTWIYEQTLRKLHTALTRLKPKYRDILKYRYFEEMTYKQIAEKTGKSMSNVKIRLMRAKNLLRDNLKNEMNEHA